MPKTTTKDPKACAVPGTSPSCIQRLDPRSRRLVERALRVLEESAIYRTEALSSPTAVRDHLRLRFAGLEHEEFHALWLDAQNCLISADRLFIGTLTQTAVYPREVVKAALANNANAVIFAHNHPSGLPEPSVADIRLTGELRVALATVDVRLLDHIIVGGMKAMSLAERGLL